MPLDPPVINAAFSATLEPPLELTANATCFAASRLPMSARQPTVGEGPVRYRALKVV
jgi:hypothetical protein